MADTRARKRLIRQWRLIELLSERERGLPVRGLCDALDTSRSTLYRDLAALIDAGVPIEREVVNGETRYRFVGRKLPQLGPSRTERSAVALARQVLGALEGSSWNQALEAMGGAEDDAIETRSSPPKNDTGVVRELEQAIRRRRQVRLLHRGRHDRDHRWRRVEPRRFVLRDQHAYLEAFCLEREDWRLFKLARIERVQPTPEPAAARQPDADRRRSHAVGVWSGKPVDVAIELGASVATLAHEWPLVDDQSLERQSDGSVLIRATVAGLAEVKRWVLGWGRDARVVSPPALRDAVRDELAGALAQYAKRAPLRASEEPVSRDLGSPGSNIGV